MKRVINFNLRIICIFILSGLIFTNCTSLRPKYKGEPYEAKNQIVTYNNPYCVERLNILGWTLNLGFSAGVGYAVYQYAPYDYKVGNLSKNEIRIGQSVLAGLLTGFLIYEFSSDGNKHENFFDSDAQNWLKRYDDDLILINSYLKSYVNSYIKAIPDDADEDFNFYTAIMFTKDIYDAKKLFLKVPFDDELKKQIENKLYNVNNLSEAKEFINLFPESEYKNNIQKNSLSYISSYKDVESYFDMFPNPNDIASLENKAIYYINTTQDLLSYSILFPNSSRADEAIEKALPNIKRYDLPRVVNTFALSNSIKKLKLKYINESEDLNDWIEAAELYPEYINEAGEKAKQYCTDIESQRRFLNTFGETDAAIDIRIKYRFSFK